MTELPPPLSLPSDAWDAIDEPFKGDVLGREPLAKQLSSYVDRLRFGAVLAIDAPWGEGKTWFTRHWATQLRQDGHCVGLIDAFQQDHVEDPFLLVAGEILGLCAGDKGMVKKLRERAGAVMGAILPVGVKAAINLAGRAVGTSDLADEFSDAVHHAIESGTNKAADAAKAWAEKKLAAHEAEKRSLQAFRTTLTEFAAKQPKPLVILVDELDRCRPAFAVRLVERIKHFFDVPNLVFVLVMNRDQLEKAVKGVYGAETDAAAYLGKFLHLSLRLPKEASLSVGDPGHAIRKFVDATLQRYSYDDPQRRFAESLSLCAVALGLSLRDIERACALYLLAGTPWPGLLAFLAALKVKHPDLFDGVRAGNRNVMEALRQKVTSALGRSCPRGAESYFRGLLDLVARAEALEDDANWQQQHVHRLFSSPPTMLLSSAYQEAFRLLDLAVR